MQGGWGGCFYCPPVQLNHSFLGPRQYYSTMLMPPDQELPASLGTCLDVGRDMYQGLSALVCHKKKTQNRKYLLCVQEAGRTGGLGSQREEHWNTRNADTCPASLPLAGDDAWAEMWQQQFPQFVRRTHFFPRWLHQVAQKLTFFLLRQCQHLSSACHLWGTEQLAVVSKQVSHCCLFIWRVSRKSEGPCCGQGVMQGARVSCHQRPGASTWVGVKGALSWRVLLNPSHPSACSSTQLRVPQPIMEVLGFCSTDVVPCCLGPKKRGRTSKEHMPLQQPFPAASCPACSEPYAYPAPQALLERSFICTGMGTKVQPALLAHHLVWPCCLRLCTPWIIRGAAGNAATQIGRRFICTLKSAQGKADEVVRSEEWFACKERLNEGLFSLEKKQHRGVWQRTLK